MLSLNRRSRGSTPILRKGALLPRMMRKKRSLLWRESTQKAVLSLHRRENQVEGKGSKKKKKGDKWQLTEGGGCEKNGGRKNARFTQYKGKLSSSGEREKSSHSVGKEESGGDDWNSEKLGSV